MSPNNRNAIIAAVIVGVLLILGLIAWARRDDDGIGTINTNSATSTPSVNANANANRNAPVNQGATGEVTEPTSRRGLTYSQALATYTSSGFRYRFVDCEATPAQLTVGQGTTFMIDNRDNATRSFGVGGTTYRLGPFGFAIITASADGRTNITCDGDQAAVLVVE